MNLRFINWYTQALGATLGVIACVYSYLKGYIVTYGNIDAYFDVLGFGGIISSYFLLPLCVLTLLFALIKSYNPDKIFFNISLENLNIGIIISTVVIGFMGTKLYFIIPAIFILFNLRTYKNINECLQHKKIDKENINVLDQKTINFKNVNDLNLEAFDEKTLKILATKKEMAKELLAKNAQKHFILEITGLTLKELEILEKELKK